MKHFLSQDGFWNKPRSNLIVTQNNKNDSKKPEYTTGLSAEIFLYLLGGGGYSCPTFSRLGGTLKCSWPLFRKIFDRYIHDMQEQNDHFWNVGGSPPQQLESSGQWPLVKFPFESKALGTKSQKLKITFVPQ